MEQISSFVFGAKELLTAIVAIVGAVAVICGWIMKPIRKQAETDKLQMEKIDALTRAVDELRKLVDQNQAVYVRDRLQTLHERYCNELGWASSDEKRRIIDWYEEYKRNGFNHLAATYAEDILHLPEKPQN